jgi:hypothetical protein
MMGGFLFSGASEGAFGCMGISVYGNLLCSLEEPNGFLMDRFLG